MAEVFLVVTSIRDYTDAVLKCAATSGWHVVFVADRRTPSLGPRENIAALGLADQERLDCELFKHCPYDHYARKNLGYIYAMRRGARYLLDIDDDNYPNGTWEDMLAYDGRIRQVSAAGSESDYVNVYLHFTSEFIWPRGLPLDASKNKGHISQAPSPDAEVAVWQGLVDGDPDVDAVYRLLFGPDVCLEFEQALPVVLDRGTYCPFNSQNTMWSRAAFALMYLPATVSFRFSDILRGYVAQRCLWAADRRLGFCASTAYQKRNVHDLLKDFEEEVPCHLAGARLSRILGPLELSGDPLDDLRLCYRALRDAAIVKEAELDILEAWCADVRRCTGQQASVR